MKTLPPIRFTGAQVLRDGAIAPGALAIEAGRFSDGCLPEVDMSGLLILPGIVDLNGGGLARHLALRPTEPFPLPLAISAADREAAIHGVTTSWMAQSWSWEGGLQGPDMACDILAELEAMRLRMLTDMRLQLRVEIHMTEDRERLIRAITSYGVDQVMFTNKLPDLAQMAGRASHKLAAWAEREGRSVEEFITRMRAAKDHAAEVPRYLLWLAESFDALGVAYGSHDDPDGETRERMRLLGARMAEFPLRAGAAAVARANGDPIILSACDIVRGGTKPGAISTMALLSKGMGDALASRDHPAGLVEAAFILSDTGVRSLAEAWALISDIPARIMGLTDRGRIAPGLRADLTIVDPQTRAVLGTICEGHLAFAGGEVAHRLFATQSFRLAAE